MNVFRKIKAWLQRRRHASDMYSTLRALDTRTLRDLGLDRSELISVAREAAGLVARERRTPFQSASLRNYL
jgi:uncharacterized protein YjiS (DUF1127 family)